MTRRSLLHTLGAVVAGGAVPQVSGQRRQRPYDIVIKNGEVRDPSRNLKARADVAIHDGKIAEVASEIPAERGRDIIDAKGLYVTPGLVDLHTHIVYGVRSGIEADPIAARSGTSTWIDAGTFAYDQIEGFRRFIVERNQCRVFGFVYLYPASRNPDIDPLKYVSGLMDATGRAAAANRDIVLGVKFQVGSNMNGRWSLDFLKVARRLCDEYELRLLTHISVAPPETEEVMALMKPGDVVTHCFNEHTLGIVDRTSGKLKPSVQEARVRGVLFDVGHGSGSFNFESARHALDQGFLPDSISSDIYSANMNGPVFDLPTTMSKLLYLGMTFDDVLKCSTVNPARVVTPLPKLGTLQVGAPGDVALLSVDDGAFELIDAQRNKVTAKQRIVSHLTICKGKRLTAPV
ncbi:MAG TPA: amidohydrolase/deacetylase family metallohydrolase [Bryobacterales bacterium]|nr:amidohydrolase/deacetylase family metallohydrolase [Bryobacterales bacterium]